MTKRNNLCATHVDMFDDVSDTAAKLVEGATHVDMFDDVSDTAAKLVEGATHVDMFDNVGHNATNFVEGVMHVETSCPPLEGGPKSLISRWGNTSEGVNDYAIADQVRNDGNIMGDGSTHLDHYPPKSSLIREDLYFLPLSGEVRRGIDFAPYPQPSLNLLAINGTVVCFHGFSHTQTSLRPLLAGRSPSRGEGVMYDDCIKKQEREKIMKKCAFTLAEGATHVDICDNIRKCAFTLAEILIALGILGVVAALTMPTLIAKYQEKQTVSKLKKVYSTLSQAYLNAINEHGSVVEWDLDKDSNRMINYIQPYMKFLKICLNNDKNICHGSEVVLYKNGKKTNNFFNTKKQTRASAVLSDGTILGSYYAGCTIVDKYQISKKLCGEYYVDINGLKSPNMSGKDIFFFEVIEDRLIPKGSKVETGLFEKRCLGNGTDSWGTGCAAWVIYNENMDYFHCDDLDWDNKKSCK